MRKLVVRLNKFAEKEFSPKERYGLSKRVFKAWVNMVWADTNDDCELQESASYGEAGSIKTVIIRRTPDQALQLPTPADDVRRSAYIVAILNALKGFEKNAPEFP